MMGLVACVELLVMNGASFTLEKGKQTKHTVPESSSSRVHSNLVSTGGGFLSMFPPPVLASLLVLNMFSPPPNMLPPPSEYLIDLP